MKSKRWIILLACVGVILLIAAAFSFINFRAMSSHLERNSNMVSSTGSTEAYQPVTPEKTGLYVDGSYRLAPALRDQIAQQLEGQPQFGQIEALNSLENNVNYPVLLVEIASQDIFWSPITARANLQVKVAYASDGDVSFRFTDPVEFKHSGDQPTLKRSGHYFLNDVSWGIISSPGYIDYLAEETAKNIASDLQKGIE